MPRPPRKYTKACAWGECGQTFHPHRRDQETCSRVCGAKLSAHRSEARRTAWAKASVKTRRPKNLERLREQLAGCKTLGDAFRLGFGKGYSQGYQACERKHAKKRRPALSGHGFVRSSLAAVVAMGER